MKNLTVIVLTHNSEKTLVKAFSNLDFASKIIVIDNCSIDQTKKIAQEKGALFITHPLQDDFAAQRNFALAQADTDWVLFLDSDEILSNELIDQIKKIDFDEDKAGYSIKRVDFFWGRKIRFGEAGNCFVTRLVNKKHGRFVRPVHEIWLSDKPVLKLEAPIYHYPHPTIAAFLEAVNFYSTINARFLFKKGKKSNFLSIGLIPLLKFVWTYFCCLGFLDGPAGFVYSFMMSFHSFLTRSKLYLLNHKN